MTDAPPYSLVRAPWGGSLTHLKCGALSTNFGTTQANQSIFRSVGLVLVCPPASLHLCLPTASTILGVAPAVEQEIAREEMGQCIRGFVAELPVDYRSVLVLSELAELPDRQIAEVLGLTLETVKIRLHRARARLREILERECALSRDERNELTCEPKSNAVSSSD